MNESYNYTRHLREIRELKQRYTDDDTCAACGIIRERLPVGSLEPHDNGVCCVACLLEYPELYGMDRDEVAVWLYRRWGEVLCRQGNNDQKAVYAARAWLRVQARMGRCDESMADIATAAFGVSDTTKLRLRRYVRELAAS